MFNQELRLLLAATALQAEVREQLHQVHSRETAGEFAWEVEHSTGVGVVRLRRRHQENVGAFPNRFQAKRIPDFSGRHANVGRSQVFSKIPLVWFKSTRQSERARYALLLA